MKDIKTELVFLVDRSGSMAGLEEETIGGYNSMLKRQRKGEGKAFVTTVLFDDKYEVLHDRVLLNEVKDITEDDYYVRGCTALLDAIGITINKVKEKQKSLNYIDKVEKVIFIITTDGMENASIEYTYEKIKRLIEKQKNNFGWEFIFLGANIDAIHIAKQFGINEDRAANYHADSEGVLLNYEVISSVISKMRCDEDIDSSWKDKIEKDYKSRG